jgi:hypothetical protein
MLGGGVRRGGCRGRGVWRVRGLGDFAGEGELFGGGWLPCGWRAGLGGLIRRLRWGLVRRRTGSGGKVLGGGVVGKARGRKEDGCVQGSKDWANCHVVSNALPDRDDGAARLTELLCGLL